MKSKLLLKTLVFVFMIEVECLQGMLSNKSTKVECLQDATQNQLLLDKNIINVPTLGIKLKITDVPGDGDCAYRALDPDEARGVGKERGSRKALLEVVQMNLNNGNKKVRKFIAMEIVSCIMHPKAIDNLVTEHFNANYMIFGNAMKEIEQNNVSAALLAVQITGVAESYVEFLMNSRVWMQFSTYRNLPGIGDAIAFCFNMNFVIVDTAPGNIGGILHQYLAGFPKTMYIIFTKDFNTGLRHSKRGTVIQ